MSKLLITGATGLLGSNLIWQAAESHEVIGWAKSSTDMPCGWTVDYFDLVNADLTRRRLRELRPDVIVHCAAMTDVERCESEPGVTSAINVDATRTLAQWCAQSGARFVFISTDSVFDGRRGHYNEEDETGPVNEYARTKLAAEEAVTEWLSDALIVRANFYGWNFKQKLSLGEWVLGKLVRRERLSAFADVRFSPLLVNHLGRIILNLVARGAKGVFHVAARNECSKHEFALMIAEIFGLDTGEVRPASVDDWGFNAQRPKNTTLAVDRISRFLRREMPSVEEGLRSFKQLLDIGYVAALKESEAKGLKALSAR